MEQLNITTDLEKYLQFGDLIIPFLDTDFIKQKMENLLEQKLQINPDYTVINAVINIIAKNIKHTSDPEFNKLHKFNRTAKQIFDSRLSTGCTDNAIIFTCIIRQLGYPCTILRTASKKWVKTIKDNGTFKSAQGHTFCECFYDGQWILVDPTCKKIITKYSLNELHLDYKVGDDDTFIPYSRNVTLTNDTISNHIKDMKQACKDFDI